MENVNKVFVVVCTWNNNGEADSYCENVFSNHDNAKSYMTRRFKEERKSGKFQYCEDDELVIKKDDDRMFLMTEYDDYWCEFNITEREIK